MSRRRGKLRKTILGVIIVLVVLFGTRVFVGTRTGVSAIEQMSRGRSPESLRPVFAVLSLTGRTVPARLQWSMCNRLRVSNSADQDRIIELLVPPVREFRSFDENTSSPILNYLHLPLDAYYRIDTVPLSTRHAIIDALLQRADPKLPWRAYRELVMVNLLSRPLDDRFVFNPAGGPPVFYEDNPQSYCKWWETEGVAPAIEAYRDWWKTMKDPLTSTSVMLRETS